MNLKKKRIFILIFPLICFILFSGIRASAFQETLSLLSKNADNDGLSDRFEQVLERGILFLQNRQSPNEPQPVVWPGDLHAGEFATYKWCCPDMRDKGYVFTLFTTPFVFHSLNIAKELPFEIVSTPEFDKMISLAVNHFTLHEEDIDGHCGIYRFFGYDGLGEFAPPHLPPDFCTTGCINVALHESGIAIRADLDFFKDNYRAPNGVFYVWLLDPPAPTDICSCTVANTLYMFATLGKHSEISEVMVWLNDILKMMMAGLPYFAEYYRSPYVFTYLSTRVYADKGVKSFFDMEMVRDLQTFILSGQQEKGNWPPYYYGTKEVDLETALALVSLLNLGYDNLSSLQKRKVKAGIQYLLNNQNSDGSWDCAPFYIDPIHVVYFGSEELTTAFCIEALAKYAKTIKKGVCSICSSEIPST